MALTCQQIVTLACQTAKCPSWVSQAQQLFNAILGELCEGYDLDVARSAFSFNFITGLSAATGLGGSWSSGWSSGFGDLVSNLNATQSGPYPLAADWLRANKDDVFYTIQGVKYVMVPVSLAEFDSQVQQAGLNAYPSMYAVDNGPIAYGNPPNMFVWCPPSGAYPVTARYYRKMADYTVAQFTDGVTVPWFPNTIYLLRRLTGEMMLLSNDDRAQQFLGGEHKEQGSPVFLGAAAILDRYLKMQGDEQVTKRVTLDRRYFGQNFSRLPNTKTVGW